MKSQNRHGGQSPIPEPTAATNLSDGETLSIRHQLQPRRARGIDRMGQRDARRIISVLGGSAKASVGKILVSMLLVLSANH